MVEDILYKQLLFHSEIVGRASALVSIMTDELNSLSTINGSVMVLTARFVSY